MLGPMTASAGRAGHGRAGLLHDPAQYAPPAPVSHRHVDLTARARRGRSRRTAAAAASPLSSSGCRVRPSHGGRFGEAPWRPRTQQPPPPAVHGPAAGSPGDGLPDGRTSSGATTPRVRAGRSRLAAAVIEPDRLVGDRATRARSRTSAGRHGTFVRFGTLGPVLAPPRRVVNTARKGPGKPSLDDRQSGTLAHVQHGPRRRVDALRERARAAGLIAR